MGESRSFPAPSTWSWVSWNLRVLLQSREKHESQREMSLKEVAWPRSHPACGAIRLQPRGFQASDSRATRSDGPSMLPMQAGRWDKTEPSSTSQGTVPSTGRPSGHRCAYTRGPSDTEAVHLGAFDFPPRLGHRGGRFQTNCEEHHCRERSGTPGLPRRAPRRSSQQQSGKLTFSEDLPRARHVLGARMPGRPQDRGTLKKMPPLLQQKQTWTGIDRFRVRLGERSECFYIEFVLLSTISAILLLALRLPPTRPPAGFLLARGIQFGQPWDGQADLRPSAG